MIRNRIQYLDNIRVLLTATVIIHHVLITYGAPGGWYYKEFDIAQLDLPTLIFLVFSVAINQAYFMGFFFFLSGYFSSMSLQTTKPFRFLFQRLIRLGLPILLYVYLISPALRLLFRQIMYQHEISWESIQEMYQWIQFGPELGPMWFVTLLLILTFLYFPHLVKDRFRKTENRDLSMVRILYFAVVIGCLTFLVRILHPVGSVFQPLNLQLPHTIQYIFLFLAGSLAFHRSWLDRISELNSKPWILLVGGLLIAFPFVFIASGGLEGDVTPAMGGINWQSFVYSLWEQLICVSLIVIFLKWFQSHADRTAAILSEMARSSYAAYWIHPLVLVVCAALLAPIEIHPLGKISLLLIPGLLLTFFTAGLIRRIPGLKQIL